MTEKFLDKVYQARTVAETQDIYGAWAKTYDDEVGAQRYQTPGRLAKVLRAHFQDKMPRVLDYGCGTGVSGLALRSAGLTEIDGIDISMEMLGEARAKGVYHTLTLAQPGAALTHQPQEYDAITAMGVVSVGAAPPSTFDLLLDGLSPGGILAFSYNDHTLDALNYMEKLNQIIDQGRAEKLVEDFGDHLVGLGTKSMIYLLQKR